MSDLPDKPTHYYNAQRREMLQFVPRDAHRILEVGCGEGVFGAGLKRDRVRQGIELHVTGIEIDSEAAAVASAHLDHVIVANLDQDELDLPAAAFDCIICNDVLEHLVTPWRILERLSSLLKPGGYFVASIPNVQYWGVIKDLIFEGDWRYADEGVLDITHLRFFTRRSIRRMYEQAGLESIELTGINSRVRGWKFDLLRLFSGGRLNDIQYLQFAVVARRPL